MWGGSSLDWAHPVVRDWFVARFGSPTEPQVQGWPQILQRRPTLIAAPTGSGKTLTAFLACIDRLVRQAFDGSLRDCTEVLYVSPLKALGNDIQKNLEGPLGEILQLAAERGLLMPEIRTAVRTGDTLAKDRRAMIKRPPHILVTTPESLYILLTAESSRKILRTVDTVIVDEIHAVAGDKRGAHLTLSLERLDALVADSGREKPIRIGLSATQKPIEQIAEFLTGAHEEKPAIVDVGHKRKLDLLIEVPRSPLGPICTNEMWDEMYDRIVQLIEEHRSTLLFVNTRRMAERIALHLGERIGVDKVAAHHGSLARKLRLDAETRLKNGQLKVLVATASLQLGIDIGHVDLVIQVSSPRSIAVTLQRIGRAGHWRGAIPKGRLFATTRDDLVELAALTRAIAEDDLDRIIIPDAPLDILAQQIVAEVCGQNDGCDEDALFDLARRAYPYRELPRQEFDAVVAMLSEGISARRGRYGAYLHRDGVHRKLRARRGARITAVTSGGAIPETALFTVVSSPEGTVVGTVDEDFAVESLAGDIFLLGNTSWLIRRVESKTGRILVEDAAGQPPNIPFWRGEAPARTAELSHRVGELMQIVSDRIPHDHSACRLIALGKVNWTALRNDAVIAEAIEWLKSHCALDDAGAEQLVEYVVSGRAVLGAVPTRETIIAERFFDEGGGMQLILHAPFGGRVNKAWGLSLRKRFCKSFNFELQAAATDNGLNIALAEQHSFPLADVFQFLQPETVHDVLQQAALTGSPIFGTRFRWDANRALALLRYRGGKKVPAPIQRIQADDLLASVFPDVAACQENIEGDIKVPDHPLVREVMKDVLHEAMDLDGLIDVLRGIQDGRIQCIAVDTPVPSAFSHEILNANPYAYLDDAPLEERRARAVEMRRVLPESVLEEVGKLDAAAIEQVQQEAWPDIRDAEELHDALMTLIQLPVASRQLAVGNWDILFAHLLRDGRAVAATVGESECWIATERIPQFQAIYPDATFLTEVPNDQRPTTSERSDCLIQMLTGWTQHLGPTSAPELASLLSLPENEVEQALLRIESTGAILRGKFRGDAATEFCDRRLLARIHRLTVATLRKEIEPVTQAQFMRWLLRWQHVAPGTQVRAEIGVLEAIKQLQGFELAANAWERDILARRIAEYDSADLDQLCLSGAIGWGRLSPHPATVIASDSARRIIPTSVAPITFFVREDSDWMQPHDVADEERALSDNARSVLELLRSRGALFFADIVKTRGKAKHEIETALWELVAAGLVTGDAFENLRTLIGRPALIGGIKLARKRSTAGRWSLLHAAPAEHSRAIIAICRMLLARYGVVFRELLAREAVEFPWREIAQCFRRMEDRGEVRGGRFIHGFIGEQFALPIAVESLRAIRRVEPNGETITISAADPLNLVGIVVPGERVPAISGRTVTYRDGVIAPDAASALAGD